MKLFLTNSVIQRKISTITMHIVRELRNYRCCYLESTFMQKLIQISIQIQKIWQYN